MVGRRGIAGPTRASPCGCGRRGSPGDTGEPSTRPTQPAGRSCAGRDPVRVHGHRDPRGGIHRPGTRPATPARLGIPGATGGRPHHQGQHLHLHEVALGGRRRRRTCRSSAPLSDVMVRPRPAAPRRGARRDCRRGGQRGPGPPAAAAGRRARPTLGWRSSPVRRGPPGPGGPYPGRHRGPGGAGPWPARHTTGLVCRPVSPADAQPRSRC